MLTASMLLDPVVLQDPYCFYATLREQAPLWVVPGTDVVTISTFDLLSEAVDRPRTSPPPCIVCSTAMGRATCPP